MNVSRPRVGEAEGAPASAKWEAPGPRVVAVNRFYWPDHAATSQILTDLASFLARRGWEVRVVTSRLRYDDTSERLASRDVRDGVSIRRVWTSRMGRARLVGRALDYLTFYVSAGAALLTEARRGDVVLVTTDPPLFAVLAAPLARLRGARLITWNHDVFPEIASALGLSWAGGRAGRALASLRNRSLRAAALNVALSGAMAERLRQSGARPAGLRVVANWSDPGIRPVAPGDNPLRRDWGLEDVFVIGYSGNLGRAHMPDKVAELVRQTRDLPGLAWLFIGGGAGMDRIRALVEESGARNVQLRPYQRREDLSLSLSAPDLHLVALDPACEGLIVPSKISGILAAGRPMLYLGDPASDLAREIVDRRVGLCLDAAAPATWRETVAALRSDSVRFAEMAQFVRERSAAEPPRDMLLRWESLLAEATGALPPEAR